MTRLTWVLLVAIVLVGAVARVGWNDVTVFSRADETVYFQYAKRLSEEGVRSYPAIVRTYLKTRGDWAFPPPLRVGYLGSLGIACKVAPRCTHHALAWVSTIAGILALIATFLFVREITDGSVALVATALSVASPLQLALGRRVLSDEMFCATVLFALFALVRAIRAPPRAIALRYAVWIVLATLALMVKETGVLMLPAVLTTVYVLRGRFELRDVSLVVLPPVLAYVTFSLFAWSPIAAFQVFRAVRTGTIDAPYIEQNNSGPAHRLLVDFLTVSPVTSSLAFAALTLCLFAWRSTTPGLRALCLVLAWTLLSTSLAPVKNLRYAVHADGMIRALAAWLLIAHVAPAFRRGKALALGLGLSCAASDVLLFHRIFVTAAVYDPVTAELTRALGMAQEKGPPTTKAGDDAVQKPALPPAYADKEPLAPELEPDYQRAMQAKERGRYSEALSLLEPIHKKRKSYRLSRFVTGFAYQKLGNPERAIEDYGLALLYVPDYPYTYVNLGYLFLDQKDAVHACQKFEQASAMLPQDRNVAWGLGECRRLLERDGGEKTP